MENKEEITKIKQKINDELKSSHPKKAKERKSINWGIVFTWIIGVVAALIMGFGSCIL